MNSETEFHFFRWVGRLAISLDSIQWFQSNGIVLDAHCSSGRNAIAPQIAADRRLS